MAADTLDLIWSDLRRAQETALVSAQGRAALLLAEAEEPDPLPPAPPVVRLYDPTLHRRVNGVQTVGPDGVLRDVSVRSGFAQGFSALNLARQNLPRDRWPEVLNAYVDGVDGAQNWVQQGVIKGARITNYGGRSTGGNAHGLYGKQVELEDVEFLVHLGNDDSYVIQIRATNLLNAGAAFDRKLWWSFKGVKYSDARRKVNLGGGACPVHSGEAIECEFPGTVIVGELNNLRKEQGPVVFDGGSYGTIDLRNWGNTRFGGGVTAERVINPHEVSTNGLTIA